MPEKTKTEKKPTSEGKANGFVASSEPPAKESAQKVEAAPEEPAIQIPEEVAELLEPVSKNQPAGEDASVVAEYMKLEMQIVKVTPAPEEKQLPWESCIEWAAVILKDRSKDFRVAAWLCFAWFRHEKITGLKKGLILLTELLKKYGDSLFPQKEAHRSKAIQFLNTSRFFKLVERAAVDSGNADDMVVAGEFFKELVAECEKQFKETPPALRDIGKAIDSHLEDAQQFLKKSAPEEEPAEAEEAVEEKAESTKTDGAPPAKEQEAQPAKTEALKTTPAATKDAAIRDGEFSSDKDALVSLKKALNYFFEEEQNGSKVRKVPKQSFVYGVSRSLVWGNLVLPQNDGNVAQIEGPNPTRRDYFKTMLSNQDWEKLIAELELEFLKEGSSFRFWLDGQRYLVEALEQMGGASAKAAEDIKFHLAKLINKFPELPKLKFKDKKTAFADEETLKWLEEEVKGILGGGGGSEPVLPPIIGEDYEPINKEYEAACAELPQKFEKNAAAMQKGISGDIRRKGRFLRLLNLANFCLQAKQFSLAKVHLSQLINKIEEYNLAEWEPALSVAVWQSTYLVNEKLFESTKDERRRSELENQQAGLFSKIGNYDSVLAIKLSKS